ncbi:MAG: NFACT family protein [Acidobacteriota bacterium]|nr:NFACT family protein [Acidobacteriota bacterium]
MDTLVLQRLTSELDEKLRGNRIRQVYALPKNDVVFVCGSRKTLRLWFSTTPNQPHLYLRPGQHLTPKQPPGFAMAARRLLNGRRIESIKAVPGERIIELHTTGTDAIRVVFELIPRRATALIVDHTDRVCAAWKPQRGRPAVSEPYTAPLADRRAPIGDLDARTWSSLSASVDDNDLVRGLLRSIAGMSQLTAREITALHRTGVTLERAVQMEVERSAKEPMAARIYSPVRLSELGCLPTSRKFLVAPFLMRHIEKGPETLCVKEFSNLSSAVATFYPLQARLMTLDIAHHSLNSGIDGGIIRLLRTLDAVSEDSNAAGDAEQHRRWADLLLIHPHAKPTQAVVRVPNAFGDGNPVDIPVDPSRSVVDNAQLYYKRARRAKRSAKRTTERCRVLEARITVLRQLSSEVAVAREIRDCQRLAKGALKQGVKIATSRWTSTEAPLPTEKSTTGKEMPSIESANRSSKKSRRTRHDQDKLMPGAGIEVFTSSDGFKIFVGRNADANERVTHKIARPNDFWLHAEGPGSHVVIRNPGRIKEPSQAALQEAASLAAYFSSARGATKANVRWTQVKHVRKPRKGPKGQVYLRRANTTLAEPVSPKVLFAPPKPTKHV